MLPVVVEAVGINVLDKSGHFIERAISEEGALEAAPTVDTKRKDLKCKSENDGKSLLELHFDKLCRYYLLMTAVGV
jgi:hypothetical protein